MQNNTAWFLRIKESLQALQDQQGLSEKMPTL